jgi:hypothetical protein
METATFTDLQSAVQAASDRLVDALTEGTDTTEARGALNRARAALEKFKEGNEAAERERLAAAAEREAAEVAQAEAAATEQALKVVTDAVERVHLPDDIDPPAPTEHPVVTRAANEVAHLKREIEKGEPERQKIRDEIAALTARANAKRNSADGIRSRRKAGQEKASDAADLHLLEVDAADLEGMVKEAEQRLQALVQPVTALRQRLADSEQRLGKAQIEGGLHGQADRARVLEGALIAAVSELRKSAANAGFMGLTSFFLPSQNLRNVANGIPV